MKQIIGSPARKERFYQRKDIRNEIIEAILGGENLLVSAPRRVGKTSILFNLIDDPDENVYAVYLNTEAIENPEDFFELLLNSVLDVDRIEGFGKFSKTVKDFFTNWGSRIKGINIGGVGVEIEQQKRQTYYIELLKFLAELKLEGKKLVILVDEFPITVEHISRKHGVDAVKHFLNQNRTLRQTPSFQENVKFIYCGSIGLFTVVKRLQATDRVNDLREIKISSLRNKDAIDFVTKLLIEKTGIIPEPDVMEYILKKIEWWIPFYFQLLVKEMADLIVYDRKELNRETVDISFEKVAENGNIYFEHFKSRLLKTFEGNELSFTQELLAVLKSRDLMEYNEILNLAEKYNLRQQLDDTIDILKYDGYIVEDRKVFRFYSPILKRWWK